MSITEKADIIAFLDRQIEIHLKNNELKLDAKLLKNLAKKWVDAFIDMLMDKIIENLSASIE